MSADPIVSVVIPHYADLTALDHCLGLLTQQTFPKEMFEVIVADNASPQGPAAVAGVIGERAILVVVEEKGAGPARNGGVARSKGRLLAFVDSDCQPDPSWLSQGVAALDDYDFVGGRVEVLVRDPRRPTAVEAFERVFAFDFKTYITKKGFAGAGNLFCPRALFDAVGGFRTGVSEDVDWSHRAVRAGYRIGYAAKAVVGHPARRTWVELTRKWRRLNVESYELVLERSGGRLLWLLRSLALPLSAAVHTPKVMFSVNLTSPQQRLLALTVLFRLRLWRFVDALRLLAMHEAA